MQLLVKLIPESPVRLPFSYFDKLSAAIYSALSTGSPEFGRDLHEGKSHHSRIKLFSFSPLHSRQTEVHRADKEKNIEASLVFKGATFFKLSSPWPELINSVGEGLLQNEQLRIGSQLFRVSQAKLLQPPSFQEKMVWRPAKTGSIVTSWTPKETQQKIYAFPDTPADGQACTTLLRTNLVHKWQRLCEIRNELAASWSGLTEEDTREAFSPTDISVTFRNSNNNNGTDYKTRLHHIRGNPVRSWQATVEVTAPVAMQRIIWGCGLGQMNSMGFGLAEEATSK